MNQYSPKELSKKLEPKLGESEPVNSCWWEGKLMKWNEPAPPKVVYSNDNDNVISAYHWSIFLTKEIAVKLFKRKCKCSESADEIIFHRHKCIEQDSGWKYHTQQLLESLHNDTFWDYLEKNI